METMRGRFLVGEELRPVPSPPYIAPPPPFDNPELPSLKPNLAIILVGLGFTFMLVCAFALFAKCMNPHFQRRRNMNWNLDLEEQSGGVKDGPGVDPKVINALPLVYYKRRSSSIKHSAGLQDLERSSSVKLRYSELESECAVCLTTFEEGEQLRQLPDCQHAFHPQCVDSWLRSQPSCPLCRRSILASKDKASGSTSSQELQPLRTAVLSDSLGASTSTSAHAASAPFGMTGTADGQAHSPEIVVVGDEPGEDMQARLVVPGSQSPVFSMSRHASEGHDLTEIQASDQAAASSSAHAATTPELEIAPVSVEKKDEKEDAVVQVASSSLPSHWSEV